MQEINRPIKVILEDFQQLVKKPENFLEGDESLINKVKISLKQTYDTTKYEDLRISNCNALPELIITNFDIEQIWQQVELQNDSIISYSVTNISRLNTNKNFEYLLFPNLKDDINKEFKFIISEKIDNFREAYDETISTTSQINELEQNEMEELDLSEENSVAENNRNSRINLKSSIVDDGFFKLNEMENFLRAEEKKLEDGDFGNNLEESLSEAEDNIDLFKSSSDDDDKLKFAKFNDFFIEREGDKKSKRKNVLYMPGSEEEDDSEGQVKSSLELRQERLQKKIKDIEQNSISEKPWQLKGEITADNRPQNSLLEEIVEFDLTSRPAPIITENTTVQLDDIIKQRIKHRVFDSVVRKVKPLEAPVEYKKKLVLDQEKSKQSLAQIYEKEFLERQASLDPESKDKEIEPELHTEIKSLMKNLFNKLDSLSNFHFTPKTAIPELKIVNNLPSISLEEVAPVAASERSLLAPEEVRNKIKGEIIGKTEKTTTDKNRDRRKKKQKQRALLKKNKKMKNISKLNPGLGNKYSHERARTALQLITKTRIIGKLKKII